MEERMDEESGSELEAVTGYQLYLHSEPEEMRSGTVARERLKEKLCPHHRVKK